METIADRVCVFLKRYGQWLALGLEQIQILEAELLNDDLDALVSFQALRDRESTQLISEYTVLLKEWEAYDPRTAEDTLRVKEAGDAVERLRAQLAEAYAQADKLVRRARDECGEELQVLRRGKSGLRDYSPPTLDSEYFDRSV